MASIVKVGDSWRVLIRRKGHDSICKTFPKKALAEQFARETESAMVGGSFRAGSDTVTVSALVSAYRKAREDSGREILDTSNEHYTLDRIVDKFGSQVAAKLSTADLVKWCQDRQKGGAGPYTVNMDISKIGTVYRHAGSLLDLRLPDVVGQARPTLHHLGLIGGGNKRTRRPTVDELERIFDWFAETPRKIGPPMRDIITLALTVGLRRGEIFRVLWADLDEGRRLVLVRDRKDPRKKIGNDQWVPLLGDAWAIVQRQARKALRIFPYHPQTVSKYFKAACDALTIPDLHFHDMRHEAASSLIEAGWSPHEVRAVTGHKSSGQLDTYVNLRPEDLLAKVVPITKAKKAG